MCQGKIIKNANINLLFVCLVSACLELAMFIFWAQIHKEHIYTLSIVTLSA